MIKWEKFDKLIKSIGSKVIKPVGGKDSLPWIKQGITYEQWREKTKKAAEENKRKFEIEHAKHVLHKAGISSQ